MKNQNSIIIAAFVIAILAILIANTFFLQISYYNSNDKFGLLSVYPIAFFAQLLLPIIFMAILLRIRNFSPVFYLIPFVLLILFIYVGIELADASYISSFYDGPWHFSRGLFVTVTGHSNPLVDRYFDIQSGFFWVTGTLSAVCGFSLTSFVSSMSLIIIKWFPVFAILLYTPILFLLYKRLLGSTFLVSVALLLHFSLEMIAFHYAAQTYGRALYWIILALLFVLSHKRDLKYSILALLIGFSLFFIHQPLSVLSLITFIAVVVYPAPFKAIASDTRFLRKDLLILPVALGVGWVSYIAYFSVNQLATVTGRIQQAIVELVTEGAEIVSSGAYRSYEPWAQIVSYKALYIFIIVGIALVLSFIIAYRKKDEMAKLAFTVLLFSTILFGGISVGLGGAGYIERLPSLLMPIIVYSFVKFGSIIRPRNLKLRGNRILDSLLVTILILIVFVGSIMYVSGRNIHSLTYSEYYSNVYLANNCQTNIENIYTGTNVNTINHIFAVELSNSTISDSSIIKVQQRAILETYYRYSDMDHIEQTITEFSKEMNIVYTNPTTIILVK